MTIAAHFLVPFYHFVLFDGPLSSWQQIGLLMVMAIVICLSLLPLMKGLFLAIVWHLRTSDS